MKQPSLTPSLTQGRQARSVTDSRHRQQSLGCLVHERLHLFTLGLFALGNLPDRLNLHFVCSTHQATAPIIDGRSMWDISSISASTQ